MPNLLQRVALLSLALLFSVTSIPAPLLSSDQEQRIVTTQTIAVIEQSFNLLDWNEYGLRQKLISDSYGLLMFSHRSKDELTEELLKKIVNLKNRTDVANNQISLNELNWLSQEIEKAQRTDQFTYESSIEKVISQSLKAQRTSFFISKYLGGTLLLIPTIYLGYTHGLDFSTLFVGLFTLHVIKKSYNRTQARAQATRSGISNDFKSTFNSNWESLDQFVKKIKIIVQKNNFLLCQGLFR